MFYRWWGLRTIQLKIENTWFNFLYKKRLGNKLQIFGFPFIFMPKGAEVKFGTGIRLISDSYFSEPGINHPVMIRLMNKNAKLTVGNNVGISGGGICVQTEVEIGNDVMLGANSFITDTDFHPVGPENRRRSREGVGTKKVTIEDNVFLGMNVIVLKGVTIGKNSIVGAGSVVATDIPPNQIWAGVPAKFVKEIKS
ncbi:Acetyltransferase (isoleucine patch superfamily) [Thermoflexibacter ruber]|uniref:Acetyltransferase (Isoleucine patch superfamily) n=2 Tax=Thermoflexibacter ruber TaxID=1003 RepID=A0A1I2ISN2_9BACT|nr:Acetyltransferase (isoleucine patch superfamily) [Thermoflexibacter ruber]